MIVTFIFFKYVQGRAIQDANYYYTLKLGGRQFHGWLSMNCGLILITRNFCRAS